MGTPSAPLAAVQLLCEDLHGGSTNASLFSTERSSRAGPRLRWKRVRGAQRRENYRHLVPAAGRKRRERGNQTAGSRGPSGGARVTKEQMAIKDLSNLEPSKGVHVQPTPSIYGPGGAFHPQGTSLLSAARPSWASSIPNLCVPHSLRYGASSLKSPMAAVRETNPNVRNIC